MLDSGNNPKGANNATKAAAGNESISSGRPNPSGTYNATGVSTDGFISTALSDPDLVVFLAMRTAVTCRGDADNPTLKEALRGLGQEDEIAGARGIGGRGQSGVAGEAASIVRWEDVEGLLFESYGPAGIMTNTPSTVSVGWPSSAESGQEEEVRLPL